VAVPYYAKERVQMQRAGDTTSSLEFHEMRPDGKPLCGPKPRQWRGYTMLTVKVGPGDVTCSACAKVSGDST
jgi:hypothetical protein